MQIYAGPPEVGENQALRGFARMRLAKGETKTVAITVPATARRRWRWSAEKGR